MSKLHQIVISGAGLAGGVSAVELRMPGYSGALIVVGDELVDRYQRSALSKDYLLGEVSVESLLVRSESWWSENGVDLLLGEPVEGFDPHSRRVSLMSAGSIAYDRLLVATGVRNRVLNVPRSDLLNIVSLRTTNDSEQLRALARPGCHCADVGMGVVGGEVAASLRAPGVDVTVVEPATTPMGRFLPPAIAALFAELHARHGVVMHFGEGVVSFEGVGAVEQVVTTTGRRLPCDFVVVGMGAEPNVEALPSSGMLIDNDVVVDEALESSIPNVSAAGDVANRPHPTYARLRLESWDNAPRIGRQAALSMLGKSAPLAKRSWFWSDQHEVSLRIAGYEYDGVIHRGSLEEHGGSAFYLRSGRLRYVISLNRPGDVRRAAGFNESGTRSTPRSCAVRISTSGRLSRPDPPPNSGILEGAHGKHQLSRCSGGGRKMLWIDRLRCARGSPFKANGLARMRGGIAGDSRDSPGRAAELRIARNGERVTYVVAEPCVDILDKASTEECPVGCIYQGGRTLYIHPDECVDCGACEPVCPQEAIFHVDDLPPEYGLHRQANINFFAELGTPGGASATGKTDINPPVIRALPAKAAP